MFRRVLGAVTFAVMWIAVKVFTVFDERDLRHSA